MKIGILISGRGSNMAAIVDAVKSGEIADSEVAVVISDKPDAGGLAKAAERGVETLVVERRGRSRVEHDAEIGDELEKRGVELVCLAGYMRLLSPEFVRRFAGKIVNIHPSLLPAFPGLDAQKQAFDAGVAVTGCTVHYVDELLDHGPTILQCEVERLDDDTVETLTNRILEREHSLYIAAIRRLVLGRPVMPVESEYDKLLISILDIALNTSIYGEGTSLHKALERVHYKQKRDRIRSSELLNLIKKRPYYVYEWAWYSEDKRTDGGWWLERDPPLVGNFTTRKTRSYQTVEEATVEYVIRELDFWATL